MWAIGLALILAAAKKGDNAKGAITAPAILTTKKPDITPQPMLITPTLITSDTQIVQNLLAGDLSQRSPYAIPGGNPYYIPSTISENMALPSYLNNQVADYGSPTGRYVMYNGSWYWRN
jgi:hypothetical protein